MNMNHLLIQIMILIVRNYVKKMFGVDKLNYKYVRKFSKGRLKSFKEMELNQLKLIIQDHRNHRLL